MQLVCVVVIFCALALASSSSIDLRQETATDTNQVQRSTILQAIGNRRHGRWLPLAYRFVQLLDDQEVSSKVFDLFDGRKKIMAEAKSCLQKNTVEFLNDNNNMFGKIISMLRMGQPLTSLKDLRDINPITVLPILWMSVQNLRLENVIHDGEALLAKVSDNCLNGDLKQYKDDVDFIIRALESRVLQETTSH